MRILVTGVAGFIGFHLAKRILERGDCVVGVDNINNYYDIGLKKSRLSQLEKSPGFVFKKLDISEADSLSELFCEELFDAVVNLAAQAGVRYSLLNPHAYINSNLVGFANVLECCRHHKIEHLVYASSSSVYGANMRSPFSTCDTTDHPLSLYAATKKSNELMAHAYSSLYGIPTTGLRFFTVYGPWGRPDMAYFSFTKSIIEGKAIDVYNNGNMKRDFTYVDDVIEGVLRVIERPPSKNSLWNSLEPNLSSSFAPYKIYNIGNNRPVELMNFINEIERNLDKKAIINYLPMQDGDINSTYADIDDLYNNVGYKPCTTIDNGIHNFVEWYKSYYNC